MTHPWDRQLGEPNLWFDRFDIYRLLGRRRSVQRAYRVCKFPDDLRGKGPGGDWYGNARRWTWKERAEAWDAHERARFHEKEAQRIEEAQNERIDMIQVILELSFDQLLPKMREPEGDKVNIAKQLFTEMLNQQRKELPVPPTGADKGGEHSGEVTITADDLLNAQRKLDSWQNAVRSASDAAATDAGPTDAGTGLLALRQCLLRLYPDPASARRVAEQAGLSLQRIRISDRAVDTWHAILSEAERNDQISDLFSVAQAEYPNNQELQSCIHALSK